MPKENVYTMELGILEHVFVFKVGKWVIWGDKFYSKLLIKKKIALHDSIVSTDIGLEFCSFHAYLKTYLMSY